MSDVKKSGFFRTNDSSSSSSSSSDPEEDARAAGETSIVPGPSDSEDDIDDPCGPFIPQPRLPIEAGQVDSFTGPKSYSIADGVCLPFSSIQVRQFLQMAPTLGRSDRPIEDFAIAQHHCGSQEATLMAIDPATGDSILHAIVNAGNIDGLYAIMDTFGRDVDRSFHRTRAAHVLMTHQNHEGNTVMHSAARTGQIQLVRAVLRLFNFTHIVDGLEVTGSQHEEETASVEDLVLTAHLVRPVLFIDARNHAGLNAASEARSLQHDEVAVYLEDFLARLDPKGRRAETEFRQQMEEYYREISHYLD